MVLVRVENCLIIFWLQDLFVAEFLIMLLVYIILTPFLLSYSITKNPNDEQQFAFIPALKRINIYKEV